MLEESELARRLELLFTVVYPRGGVPHSTAVVAAEVNRVAGGDVVSAQAMDERRQGRPGSADLGWDSARVARFFGVPTRYLSRDGGGPIVDAQLELLASLRAWDEARAASLIGVAAEMITGSKITDTNVGLRSGLGRPVCLRLARTWKPEEDELNTGRGYEQRLWRRCQQLVRDLEKTVGLPNGDPEDFLGRLGRERGRPIELRAFDHAEIPEGICGLWIERTDSDVIGFPVDARNSMHIVMHEVGHMLAGHRGRSAVGASQLSRLMPDLDPAMVRMVLGRSVYSAPEEREAELVASLIMERTVGSRTKVPQPALDSVQERLHRTFGA